MFGLFGKKASSNVPARNRQEQNTIDACRECLDAHTRTVAELRKIGAPSAAIKAVTDLRRPYEDYLSGRDRSEATRRKIMDE